MMIVSPILAEALESVAAATLGSGLVMPLASFLKRRIRRSAVTVAVKLPTGKEVRLELDGHLSQEQVSELVSAAVLSAQAGDEPEVQRTISASHTASQKARDDGLVAN